MISKRPGPEPADDCGGDRQRRELRTDGGRTGAESDKLVHRVHGPARGQAQGKRLHPAGRNLDRPPEPAQRGDDVRGQHGNSDPLAFAASEIAQQNAEGRAL